MGRRSTAMNADACYPRQATPTFSFVFAYSKLRSKSMRCCSLSADVAFGVAHGPVEGTETAIFRAEIGVINVAIDDVRDHALGMEPLAEGIGGHADTDQVVGTEKVQGFGVGDHQAVILRTCWAPCAKT